MDTQSGSPQAPTHRCRSYFWVLVTLFVLSIAAIVMASIALWETSENHKSIHNLTRTVFAVSNRLKDVERRLPSENTSQSGNDAIVSMTAGRP